MKSRSKWVLALVITATVFLAIKFEERGALNTSIKSIVKSGEDFVAIRKWTMKVFGDEKKESPISVSAPGEESPLATFSTLQPFTNGVLLSYEKPIKITAKEDGLIIYTGHTRSIGKSMRVLYESGDVVTYGYLDDFTILPYTAVTKGEVIADVEPGTLFIQVERDGKFMSSSAVTDWLEQK